jgi:hypothetical protein
MSCILLAVLKEITVVTYFLIFSILYKNFAELQDFSLTCAVICKENYLFVGYTSLSKV